MNKIVDYKRDKKNAVKGIVFSVVVLMMGLIGGLTGLFFYLDSASQAAAARQGETVFDPWEDSGEGVQNSWKTWEVMGLTDEFASDFKETYHYYFAIDPEWCFTIVKMKGELGEEFQPCVDYVYEEEAEEPEPVHVRGVAVPIEDDIREYAIEYLNLLYDEDEFMSEEYFEYYMGVSLLDLTQKPAGKAKFGTAMGFGLFGLAMSVWGGILLMANIMQRNDISLKEKKEKEKMHRIATWQSNPDEDDTKYRGAEDERYRWADGVWTGGSAQGGAGAGEESQGSPRQDPDGNQGWNQSGGMGYDFAGNQTYNLNGVRLTPVKKSNVFLGIIGAIGGSLVGAILWVGISLIGFIAGVAGFVMLKFALKGYEKLSGKLDKKGAVISLIIAALMVFFANVADYVVTLCRAFFEWDASLDTVWYVIRNFGALMTDADCWGGFFLNLIIGYGLSIWSSLGLIRWILKYKEN